MSKIEYIERIDSYLKDGFVQFPSGIRNDLEFNNVTLAEFRTWVELSKKSLEAVNNAQKLVLIPEGILSSITGNIEGIRNHIAETEDGKPDPVNNFTTAVNHAEQLISQLAPYLNLVDSINYRNLSDQVEQTITSAQDSIASSKKNLESLNKSTKNTDTKSQNLLKRISSGVLSENFGNLSNSIWNWSLMIGAAGISTYAFIALLHRSSALTKELIIALQKGNVDYRIFFAKWSLTIPYLLLLAIGLLELRSRIRLRDTYIFREKVAGSLDGYTEILLDKAGNIRESQERSAARRAVIEFMMQSMLELTKTPTMKIEKQKIGLRAKDIAEANFSNS